MRNLSLTTRVVGRCCLRLLIVALCVFSSACASFGPAAGPLRVTAYDGQTARPIAMEQVHAAAAEADVILIGEQHGHAAGHRLQRRLIDQWAARGWLSAISLEMLTRDEQPLVDDYLAGRMSRRRFVEAVAGDESQAQQRWRQRYQPLVDVAREHGAPIVAANAPRDLVKRSREQGDGFEAELSPDQRRLVTLPQASAGPDYRERFAEAMRSHPMPEGQAISDEMVESMFRSQRVWDATMADSVAGALSRRGPRVVHTVGQFHIAHGGGLVTDLRRAAPGARILTVAIRPADDDEAWQTGVADLVLEVSH